MAQWPWWWSSRRQTPRPEVTAEEWGLLEQQRREQQRLEQQRELERAAAARRAAVAAERRELGQRAVVGLNRRNVIRELEMVQARRANDAELLVNEQAAQLHRQQRLPNATMVVGYLTAALFLLSAIRGASGASSPDHGDEFRRLSIQLRNDASRMLRNARPTAWFGTQGAAAHYDHKVTEQQAQVDTIAATDHQVAGIIATQASQVKQGCEILDAILLTLVVGIGVAVTLDTQWKAAIAAGSPAAPALAAVLLAFGAWLLCSAVTVSIDVLTNMLVTGQLTESALQDVIDNYSSVAKQAAEASGERQRWLPPEPV
ncbi:MAG: hypothetical protein K2Q25_15305 [Mycobacteriaceae bacterium]|nr:hypothetical protein [Mycobacteriaceae bacterium]